VVYLKPKQLIIKDCARRFCIEAVQTRNTRGLFATAEFLVLSGDRSVVSLRCVQVGAWGQSPSPLVWRHHASYRGPELVWATGRLVSPDRGFGTSCLLHCGHLTVSANSEDSWKRFRLSRTRLRRLVTLALGAGYKYSYLLTYLLLTYLLTDISTEVASIGVEVCMIVEL